jgi:hypothetical protein
VALGYLSVDGTRLLPERMPHRVTNIHVAEVHDHEIEGDTDENNGADIMKPVRSPVSGNIQLATSRMMTRRLRNLVPL